jgi:hypothetical protein
MVLSRLGTTDTVLPVQVYVDVVGAVFITSMGTRTEGRSLSCGKIHVMTSVAQWTVLL